ncbi:MAG TPA: DUF4386 domain-containing protein [Opitutaceae bacterium]|nr:DUF4386 domain-containing protein [Opitutaceae bacterium]
MNTSTLPPIEPAQQTAARVVGALYLIQMATAVFGQIFVRDALIVRGDLAKTAENIAASEQLFRLSIAGDLITYSGVIVLAWAFYVVVKPVDKNLALLAVFFRLVENAVLFVATIGSMMVLRFLSVSGNMEAFEPGQLHAMVSFAIRFQGVGMSFAFILLGLGSTVFSYLLLKSRYVPKAIAVWGIFASLVLAAGPLAIIVFPPLAVMGISYMAPMGIFEVGLGFWLLFKGLRLPRAAQTA